MGVDIDKVSIGVSFFEFKFVCVYVENWIIVLYVILKFVVFGMV